MLTVHELPCGYKLQIVEDVDDSGVTMLVPMKWKQIKDNLVDMGASAEEDSVDFVVNDSHSPYLPSRLFFHFLIITKGCA